MKEKIGQWLKIAVQFLLNPRLLFCFGIAWIITNGWSYILFGLGTYFGIGWMVAVAGSYLAFLWFPFSPEKLATVAIAIFLLRRLFPRDQKTLAVLRQMKARVKAALQNRKKNKERDDG
ncbi:MAG: hypothetical protein IKB80_01665 [Oscillospiraceae bacterium]|nr:hypothetical protein [Oscillospiraceae bacterium]